MDLQSFVRETLVEILEGVSEAQAHLRARRSHGRSATVSPTWSSAASNVTVSEDHRLVHMVDFDVAVTVETSKSTESTKQAEGGIKYVIAVGGSGSTTGEDATSNSTITRIKFSVPVAFPDDGQAPQSKAGWNP